MQDMRGVPRRFGHHDNAFGALRLLFASLVIASHAPELVDGDKHREILTQLFGTTTFGKSAVIGFFVISGYLITGSLLNSRNPWDYLARRIARIYPAYLFAFAFCVIVVAPLAGATLPTAPGDILKRAFDALALQIPWVPGAFAGSPYPTLNGSMWTIAYEFRCYLIIMLLGLAGVLRWRGAILALAAILVASTVAFPASETAPLGIGSGRWAMLLEYGIGSVRHEIRFIGAFLAGACFYLYRERLRFAWPTIALATCALVAGLSSQLLHVPALIICGGYLTIAAAARASWLNRINNENDISYGVYLYAWPITKLLNWWWPWMHPLAVGLLTLACACLCGWASWRAIEKPAMELVQRHRRRQEAATA